ncbi:MAG: hypothetical protein WC346_14930 [Methanogenium sp.]|jgi:hypothetical protein
MKLDIKNIYKKQKVRLDRGRLWYALLQTVVTALMVNIYGSGTSVLMKVIYSFAPFVLVYVLGFIDDKLKLLELEQGKYAERNPVIMDMAKDIKELKDLYEKNTK